MLLSERAFNVTSVAMLPFSAITAVGRGIATGAGAAKLGVADHQSNTFVASTDKAVISWSCPPSASQTSNVTLYWPMAGAAIVTVGPDAVVAALELLYGETFHWYDKIAPLSDFDLIPERVSWELGACSQQETKRATAE